MKTKKSLKIGFVGSHILSWFCLKTIAELCDKYGDKIEIVFNLHPEKGKQYSAFQEFDNLEKKYNFQHFKVDNLDQPHLIDKIESFDLDILFVIGWHKIISQNLIKSARYCIGMHTSLLPKNRGSAPVNWQIIRKEKKGGITMFHLTTGVDTGDVISQKKISINKNDTCKDIHEKSILGAIKMLREEWNSFKNDEIKRKVQIESKSTLNKRRKPEDGKIDWVKSSDDINSLVRASTFPYPGAFGYLNNRKIIIWSCTSLKKDYGMKPGTIICSGKKLIVQTGSGSISLLRMNFVDEPDCDAELFSLTYNIENGVQIK